VEHMSHKKARSQVIFSQEEVRVGEERKGALTKESFHMRRERNARADRRVAQLLGHHSRLRAPALQPAPCRSPTPLHGAIEEGDLAVALEAEDLGCDGVAGARSLATTTRRPWGRAEWGV